jgi:DNA-binding GntR family transcriptional regulator
MPELSSRSQAAPDAVSHVHLSQRAYVALRAMAMSYRFQPGQRLNEGELARELEISRTPLREAMHRLVSEGLLALVPGRGFFARPLEVKEVFDLYEARLGLEIAIVELACERATDEWLAAMDLYLDDSVQVQESAPVEHLLQLDEGFHERLAEVTGNAELLRMLRNINARIHFFRWVDMQGRRDLTQAEHRALVAAIRARDAATASDLARVHITRRLDQIVEVMREGYARLYMGERPTVVGWKPPPASRVGHR